jgi:hypothetical protein
MLFDWLVSGKVILSNPAHATWNFIAETCPAVCSAARTNFRGGH